MSGRAATSMIEPPPRGTERGEARGARNGSLTPVAWRARPDISFGDWVEHGRRLGVVGRSAGWWIGDWLGYGNAAYGERYARAARITGYDVQTLMNMVYIASRFDPSRRRENLSWSHHAEVAALTAEDQERLLGRAEAERLSVRCLREEMRRERRIAKVALHRAPAPEVGAEPAFASAADANGGVEAVCPHCGHALGER